MGSRGLTFPLLRTDSVVGAGPIGCLDCRSFGEAELTSTNAWVAALLRICVYLRSCSSN